MPVIAIHTNTMHINAAARKRLMEEAQGILNDRTATDGRRDLARAFIRRQGDGMREFSAAFRAALAAVDGMGDDDPPRAA